MKRRADIFAVGLFQFLLSYAVCILTVMCFLDGFKLPFSTLHICLIALPLLCLVFAFFGALPEKRRTAARQSGRGKAFLSGSYAHMRRKRSIVVILGLLFAALAFMIIYTLINFKMIYSGFSSIINEIKRAFTQYYGGAFMGNVLDEPERMEVTYASIIIVFFESFPVYYVIRKGGPRFILFIASFGLVALPFFAGLIPGNTLFLFYILCIVPVFTTSAENRKKRLLRTSIQMLVFFITLVCLFVSVSIFSKGWYEKNFNAEKTKQTIQESTYKLESDLFQKLFHSMEDSATYAGGLNKGELGWADEIKYSNKSALEITIPEEIRDTESYSLFFRSYIGESYESNRFSTVSREGKLEKDGLDKKYGLDVGELNSVLFSHLNLKNTEETISIKNIWAGDDYFAPYACTEDVGYNRDGKIEYQNINGDSKHYDVGCYYFANDMITEKLKESEENDFPDNWWGYIGHLLPADEEETYKETYIEVTEKVQFGDSLVAIQNDSGNADGNNSGINLENISINDADNRWNDSWNDSGSGSSPLTWSEYLKMEMDYRDYVYKYDLRIPNGICSKTVSAFQNLDKEHIRRYSSDGEYDIYHLTENPSGAQINEYIQKIKDYLEANTSYSLSPGHLPSGEDFTQYFLFDSKKGYCTYYAAAATIAFRSLGIPARYTEGFKASKQDIDNARSNGDGTITFILKDVNAHAWVEIYINGYGWYPVEVTPGFSQNSNAETVEGVLEHESPSPFAPSDGTGEENNEEGNNNETEDMDGSIGLGENTPEDEYDPDEYDPGEYDPYSFDSPSSENAGSNGSGGLDANGNKASFWNTKTGKVIMLCILLVLLFGIVVFTAIKIRALRIQKKLKNPILAKRALCLYHMLEDKLLRLAQNTDCDNLSALFNETGGVIALKNGTLDLQEELGGIQDIGEKACFSGKDIRIDEWEKMKKLYGAADEKYFEVSKKHLGLCEKVL